MAVKKIREKDARSQKAKPHSAIGPSLKCLNKSKQEYYIVPGPKTDQFTLWQKNG